MTHSLADDLIAGVIFLAIFAAVAIDFYIHRKDRP
jgi:hypothetical protein